MKLKNIYQGIIDGSIKVDLKGHYLGGQDIIEITTDRLEFLNEIEGKELEYEYKIGDTFLLRDLHCFYCGEYNSVVKFNGDTVTIGNFEKINGKYEDKFTECTYAQPKPITGILDIDSKLAVVNFFVGFEHPENRDTSNLLDYSVNHYAGRLNTTNFTLENDKIFYGQMGNQTIAFFINSDKTEILVSDYYDMSEDSEDGNTKFNDYTFAGSLSLEMWRYEVGDYKTLKTAYQKTKKADGYKDGFTVDVTKGKWQFTHYERTYNECPVIDGNTVYARFNLVK